MGPLLVLLPGLDGTRFLFQPILREWGADAVVVSYAPSLPSDYAALLPVVLEALPTDRDFLLLGWSFSGPLALMAAALNPPRLRGVVLCASFVEKPMFWLPKFARHLARPALFGFTGALAAAKTALAGKGSPEINALIRRAHGAVPAPVMAARVQQILRVQVQAELEACPVPILYLKAKNDGVVTGRNARQIQRLRPDVEVRTIAGPHIALATNPVDAARAIRDFARKVLVPAGK